MDAHRQASLGPPAEDLAAAALAAARRVAAGGRVWCAVPSSPWQAEELAERFSDPEPGEGRSLAALPVPGEDLLAGLRVLARSGDVLVLVAGRDGPATNDLRQRSAAWGVLTIWIGDGSRPDPGAADYVLWVGDEAAATTGEQPAATAARLLALVRERLEQAPPELVSPAPAECGEEVCITCSDEGRVGEVVAIGPDGLARVRTPAGVETVDMSLVSDPRPGDLVLIHAGTAVRILVSGTLPPDGKLRVALEPEEAR